MGMVNYSQATPPVPTWGEIDRIARSTSRVGEISPSPQPSRSSKTAEMEFRPPIPTRQEIPLNYF
jgi:hypothetical protein